MPRKKTQPAAQLPRGMPATNPEDREKQLINLAVNLAEQQLIDGTASSQIVTHYLKLATQKAKAETELVELQKELVKAKTENLQTSKNIEELYADAIAAFTRYNGHDES